MVDNLDPDSVSSTPTDPNSALTQTDPNADIEALKNALAKERALRASYEKQGKSLQEIMGQVGVSSPEEITNRLKAFQNAEKVQAEIDRKFAQERQELLSRAAQERDAAIAAEIQQRETVQRELESLRSRTALQQAFGKFGGDSQQFDDFLLIAQRMIQYDSDAKTYVVLDNDGKRRYRSNEPWLREGDASKNPLFTLEDLMQESLLNHRAHYFKPQNLASGSGLINGMNGTGNTEGLTPAQKRAVARANAAYQR
jgi:hypothetical protein